MGETTLKIALAGLMHDIGKFAQGCLSVRRDYLERNATQYQPFRDGHHTHIHSVFTAAFIEQMANVLPSVFNNPGWGEGDSFINLAAGHHKPETPMQWIITMADRISSGLDRATFEKGEKIAFQDFKKTRLLPVLESIGPDRCKGFNSPEKFQFEYPLKPLSAKAIFPAKRDKRDRHEAEDEYSDLFDDFVNALGKLSHREISVELWAQHFDSLYTAYAAVIPAARVGDVVHDVSLYDHSRSTAALAAALYRYHAGMKDLDERSIKEGTADKFLIVGGDFYGIQDFIFSSHGESKQFRAKLLRGRSFAVSLFSELAARLICNELGLPFLSVLLNAAGKFHILAANLPETDTALKKCEAKINDWLFEHTYGESSIGISWTAASPEDFHAGRFRDLWDRHLQKVEKRKYHKVDLERQGGVVEGYLDSFNNEIEGGKRLCPLCGKRPSVKQTQGDYVFGEKEMVSCAFCRDHVFLGSNLVRGKRVAICADHGDMASKNSLMEPIFGCYQITFASGSLEQMANKGKLLDLWHIGIEKDGTISPGVTVKLINGHVPWYRKEDNYDDCLLESVKTEGKLDEMISQIKEGAVKTFNHIAVKARHKDEDGKCRGIEALGVLKADVDNLGMLFGCGLSDDRFTISRLVTVSRQLNNFFALYLPYLLESNEKFFDVYTVFAGGDDLFLIGPWNRMAELACLIREKFIEFTCNNPQITISAGISTHRPNTPVDVMAENSEEALKMSKKAGRDRVTMFGQIMEWEAFKKLLNMQEVMEDWLEKGYISDVMFYRFNYFIDMAEQEVHLSNKRFISVDELSCLKWPALFKYSLIRNVTKDKKLREKALEDVSHTFEWIKTHRGGMRIPLWHVLYEKRR